MAFKHQRKGEDAIEMIRTTTFELELEPVCQILSFGRYEFVKLVSKLISTEGFAGRRRETLVVRHVEFVVNQGIGKNAVFALRPPSDLYRISFLLSGTSWHQSLVGSDISWESPPRLPCAAG